MSTEIKNLQDKEQTPSTTSEDESSLASIIKKSFEAFGADASNQDSAAKDSAGVKDAAGVNENANAAQECACPKEGGAEEKAAAANPNEATTDDFKHEGSEIIGIPGDDSGNGQGFVESVPRQLTIAEIEQMNKAEAGGEEGGHNENYDPTLFGMPYLVQSVPRNLHIGHDFLGVIKVYIPPPVFVEQPPLTPPHECVPGVAHDDKNIVFEQGLEKGDCDECGHKQTVATGNLLTNDQLNDSSLCSVTFEGKEYTPDVNGVITINTEAGVLVVYTKNFGNHDAGDYIFTLTNAIDHPWDKFKNIINEVFTYTLCDPCGDKSSAKLTIKIVDSVPEAHDDCLKIVHENLPCNPNKEKINGNVLSNDCKGADTPVRVVSFTYDCGKHKAYIPIEQGVTSTTVITEHGGKLTVFSNGDWSYVPQVSPDDTGSHRQDAPFRDDFSYTIQDKDGDKSSATQPILVLEEIEHPKPIANDDCNVVFESGLPCGSDRQLHPNNIKPTCATGNVLTNDIVNGASITEVCFNGHSYKPINGVITIDTGVGIFVLYVENKNDHLAGDYKFSLTENAIHPNDNGNNKIEQEFTYKLSGDCGSKSDKGTLTIKIVDDVPKAVDDFKATVRENLPCSPSKESVDGNVLTNDIKGADKPVHVISFTYDNGTKCATIANNSSTTVLTAHGGLLTVASNGEWKYVPQVSPDDTHSNRPDAPFYDSFSYSIQDGDGDKSSATQPIYVIEELKSQDCEPKPPCDDTPPVVCDPKPPCETKPPVCEDKLPVCEQKTSCDDKPPHGDNKPPICDEKLPVFEQKPSCDPKPPVCEDKSLNCDDKPLHQEKFDDKPRPDNDKGNIVCDEKDNHYNKSPKCDDKPHYDNNKGSVVYNEKDNYQKGHEENQNHNDKSSHEGKEGRDCVVQPTCGNVIKDGYDSDSHDGLRVSGFKYYDEKNKLCSGKIGETVKTYSGAEFTMYKDGNYKHVQHDINKSFSDSFSYTVKDAKGFNEKSSFSIHTSDVTPHEDHTKHQQNENNAKNDYIVDASDISPKHSLSMKELGLNHKLDNLPGNDSQHQGKGFNFESVGLSAHSANDNSHSGSQSHGLPLVHIEHNGSVEQHFQQAAHETHVLK